ncbi:phage tail tube protein [Microbacterium sp. USHLN272]|uniref:phage tail tube protein n=1 Tax=Microbacterium sp. USHLN272 TaxID=3081287 RepID=UPI003018CA67
MTVNANNARIFGSDSDAIYLAPIGTPLPESIDDELDAAFEDVGWLNGDGITESLTGSVEKSRGYQGNGVVRTRISEPGTTVAFVALETKAQTNGLRYVEKSSATTAGVRKTTRGSGQRVTKRACVIDKFDSDDVTVKERDVIEVLEISPNGDRVATNADIAMYPFLGEIIGDYDHYETDTEADGDAGTQGFAAMSAPDESWTVAQLKDYASENEIDLAGASLKAEILAAVSDAAPADTAETAPVADAANDSAETSAADSSAA